MERPNLIPIYLEASNKDSLVKKMLSNNIKHSCHFKYFDIQKDGSKWVAWYYAIIDLKQEIAKNKEVAILGKE